MRVKQEHLNILVDYNLNCNPVNSLKIMLFGILANLQTLMLIINSSNVDKTIPPNGIIKRRILFLSGAHSHSEAASHKRN